MTKYENRRCSLGDILEAWDLVDVRGTHECWPWRGTLSRKGYGRIRWPDGRETTAHRAIFQDVHQFTDEEMPEAVCHRCDNPPCCNPRHLFGGTYRDNNLDMHAKGRGRRQLLPLPTMQAIYAEYLSTEASTYDLARAFGVAQTTVYNIVNGRERWSA